LLLFCTPSFRTIIKYSLVEPLHFYLLSLVPFQCDVQEALTSKELRGTRTVANDVLAISRLIAVYVLDSLVTC
jgi:hypothetical protein